MRWRRRHGARRSWGKDDADAGDERWAMLSPRSRGKGGRRFPGRDGGRRKSKPVEWRNRAPHSVKEPTELPGDLVVLTWYCPFGRSPAESIYLFDQGIARTGIRYHAELFGSRLQPGFIIRVPAEGEATARAIIARIGEG